jgi:hypothetical protein
MLPLNPEVVPEIEVKLPSGEVTEDCRLAVRLFPLPSLKVAEPGPKEFEVPLAKLFGLPLSVQVTVSVFEPVDAVTDGLAQDTTV